MPEPIPQKIQMIKEIRQMTGLGLGESKQIADALCRPGGPIDAIITEVQAYPGTEYKSTPATIPDLSTAPRLTAGVPYYARADIDKTEPAAEDLGTRVARIEAWIRAEADK